MRCEMSGFGSDGVWSGCVDSWFVAFAGAEIPLDRRIDAAMIGHVALRGKRRLRLRVLA